MNYLIGVFSDPEACVITSTAEIVVCSSQQIYVVPELVLVTIYKN